MLTYDAERYVEKALAYYYYSSPASATTTTYYYARLYCNILPLLLLPLPLLLAYLERDEYDSHARLLFERGQHSFALRMGSGAHVASE